MNDGRGRGRPPIPVPDFTWDRARDRATATATATEVQPLQRSRTHSIMAHQRRLTTSSASAMIAGSAWTKKILGDTVIPP